MAASNSNSAPATIYIYLRSPSGKPDILADSFSLRRWQAFSDFEYTGPNPNAAKLGVKPNSIVIVAEPANGKAAAHITTWMATNDIANPRPPAWDPSIDYFDELCHLHLLTRCFCLKCDRRGDNIRDEIVRYINGSPLSIDDFALIVEWLKFDKELVHRAKQAVMRGWARPGTAAYPPQMDEIETYAREKGIWDGPGGMHDMGKAETARLAHEAAVNAERGKGRVVQNRPAPSSVWGSAESLLSRPGKLDG
jgi:hypothetical protein